MERAFPQRRVAFSLARPGPAGGPQGGVAGVVPHQWEVIGACELVRGACVQATAQKRGTGDQSIRIQSLYIPPDDKEAVVQAYVAADWPDPGCPSLSPGT